MLELPRHTPDGEPVEAIEVIRRVDPAIMIPAHEVRAGRRGHDRRPEAAGVSNAVRAGAPAASEREIQRRSPDVGVSHLGITLVEVVLIY